MTLTWPTKYETPSSKCLLKNDLITDEQTNFSP